MSGTVHKGEAPPAREGDEPLTRAIERTRRALERARLYGVHHPEAEATIDHAWEAWREALSGGRSLVLGAGLDGLAWSGRVLVPEDEDREGLGRLLHREGIAELTVHPVLTRAEFSRFLDVVRVNLGLPEHEEENLESLLWQARIEGLSFRAVAALMEAEAISGDAIRYLQTRPDSRLAALAAGGSAAGRATRLAGPGERVADDTLVRAVAEGEQEMIAGEDGAWDVADEPWQRALAEAEAEAAAAVAEVARELPGDQIRRASAILLRAARADREELSRDEAMSLVSGAVDEVFRQHDTFALAQLIHLIRAENETSGDPALGSALRALLGRSTLPIHIARLLSQAGPDADPGATDELAVYLDDNATRALIEWSFADASEGVAGRGRWLASGLGTVLAERARHWLWRDGGDPTLLIPAAMLLRGLDADADRLKRPAMLRHPASRVGEIALEWYRETGLPSTDIGQVLDLLEDRRPRIRAAALGALATAPSIELQPWFGQRITTQALDGRRPELQRDLCVACGRLLGTRAQRSLQLLLDRRLGLFAGKKETSVVEAAAFGLVAIGSPEARALVEEGAKSWVGAKALACKAALSAKEPA